MPTADVKYIPQVKKKPKISKVKRVASAPTFPTQVKHSETKPLKKKSPFGDHYVWSK